MSVAVMLRRRGKLNRIWRARRVLLWTCVAFVVLQAGLGLKHGASFSRRFNEAELNHVPDLAESIVQWQVSNLIEDLGPIDVVFFGDSSCLMGVMPRIVEEDTGLHCWNFGTIGWLSTDGHADLLQLYVDRHGPPRLAIYYVTTWPLTASHEDIKARGYLTRLREWLASEKDESDVTWLDRLPSTRMRQWFQTVITRDLVGMRERQRFLSAPRGAYPSDADVHSLLKKSRGFMAELATKDLERDWEENASWATSVNARPKLATDCISGLRRTFALADACGFDLIVRLNPLPEAFSNPATDEAFARLEEDLEALAASYQRVYVASPLLRYYPNSQHATVTHLSEAGARRNSHELADLLARFRRGLAALPARTVDRRVSEQ